MRAEALKKSAAIESALHETQKIPFIVSDAIEDGVRLARRAAKHSLYSAEDAIAEAEHIIRRRPFQTMALVFAAGVLAGGFLTWSGLRRR